MISCSRFRLFCCMPNPNTCGEKFCTPTDGGRARRGARQELHAHRRRACTKLAWPPKQIAPSLQVGRCTCGVLCRRRPSSAAPHVPRGHSACERTGRCCLHASEIVLIVELLQAVQLGAPFSASSWVCCFVFSASSFIHVEHFNSREGSRPWCSCRRMNSFAQATEEVARVRARGARVHAPCTPARRLSDRTQCRTKNGDEAAKRGATASRVGLQSRRRAIHACCTVPCA